MNTCAYNTFNIKSFDEEQRIIEGIASTPAVDRENDVIDPKGMEFKTPFPFLWQHRADSPIGTIITAKATRDGLAIKVQIAEAGLDAEIDRAWTLIKSGLVRGLSVGFRSIEHAWDDVRGGMNYKRVEILEVSAVTISANAEAKITNIKSNSGEEGAALGNKSSNPAKTKSACVRAIKKEDTMDKQLQEQIKSFEATRQAKAARMAELMGKAGSEGRTLDAEEAQEYDDTQIEVKSIDEHLVRLHEQEKLEVSTATAIKGIETPEAGSKARGGGHVISVKGSDLPKGTAFVRYVMALAAAKGNRLDAAEYARSHQGWKDTTPQVAKMFESEETFRRIKAPVAPGSTTGADWAAPLVNYQTMASEFIEYLRPMTIIGRIPNLRQVPFNIQMPKQTAGSSTQWVGQGARKPVSRLSLGTVKLDFAKSSSIIVLNEELVRFSNPSAEAIVRQDLAEAITQFLDEQFINPTVAAVAGVSPASITNGAPNAAATGTDLDGLDADVKAAIRTFTNANIGVSGLHWITRPEQALSIGLMRNAFGLRAFEGLGADGGSMYGYPVLTSNSVPSGVVALVKPTEIFLADDNGISIDISREASIVMESDGSATGEPVSMFQNNMVALRAERYINWARRHEGVYYISGANYGA